MSVQRDKTLPAAVLIVPSSAFSSFLTFSIARIDSGMPGRELGGEVHCLRWKKKGFVWAAHHWEFWDDMKENKMSNVEWSKNRGFFCPCEDVVCARCCVCCGIVWIRVKIDAFRHYVSHSFDSCALCTGRWHFFRATQSVCVINWMQAFICHRAALPREVFTRSQ